MLEFTFELNGQPLTSLKTGVISFPAFSGLGDYVNKRHLACIRGFGPIPPGTYYIFDRQSGGMLGNFRDMWSSSNKKEWLSLYGIDNKIDDEVYCEQVKRGNFRLHPKGHYGRSEGCITIENLNDFYRLRAMLKSTSTIVIPGVGLHAYGRVTVR